jgi:hypothetical protein
MAAGGVKGKATPTPLQSLLPAKAHDVTASTADKHLRPEFRHGVEKRIRLRLDRGQFVKSEEKVASSSSMRSRQRP